MLSFLRTFIHENMLLESRKTDKVVICKDELENKKPSQSKPKKRVTFETKTLLQKEVASQKKFNTNNTFGPADNENKPALKVKILMTKAEAARLLSKCKDGGVLEIKDVARELVQIPSNRVSMVSTSSNKSNIYLLANTDKEH